MSPHRVLFDTQGRLIYIQGLHAHGEYDRHILNLGWYTLQESVIFFDDDVIIASIKPPLPGDPDLQSHQRFSAVVAMQFPMHSSLRLSTICEDDFDANTAAILRAHLEKSR